MKKLLATTALFAVLASPASATGFNFFHFFHHYKPHYYHPPKPEVPAKPKPPTPGQQSSNNVVGDVVAGWGVCNLTGHFFDTFIRDRGQYKGTKHVKRTYGDQAAVIGNCVVPFIGGLVARRLTGKDENKPLAFYSSDAWMFIHDHGRVN